MKKPFNLILTLAILLIYSCNTNEDIDTKPLSKESNFIPEKLAISIAENFSFNNTNNLNAKTETNNKTTKKIKEIVPYVDDKKQTIFYIINYENNGFLLLSADNRISPVLAYSENNSFRTNLKTYYAGLSDWIDYIRRVIENVRINKVVQNKAIKLEWDNFITAGGAANFFNQSLCDDPIESIGPLLTTYWGQSCSFNDLLPELEDSDCLGCGFDDNNSVLVGCGQLAIAQVMKYHQHPQTHRWWLMPDNIGTFETQSLMLDIHNRVSSTKYKCEGTSSKISGLKNDLKNEFNYSFAEKKRFDTHVIINDLRNNKPIIFSARHTNDDDDFGHAWVCDGYKREKICLTDDDGNEYIYPYGTSYKLHMNWGWNGRENGWYNFTVYNPSDFNFEDKFRMIHNITP